MTVSSAHVLSQRMLGRLFKFDHLAGARLVAHLQPIYIDSGGDGMAVCVAAIPSQQVLASGQRTRPYSLHRLSQNIVDG